jgi:peptidoglycan/xylan/chitin deacetylase (PgdA/CDA1 family)
MKILAESVLRMAVKALALPFGVGKSRGEDLVILLYHRVGVGEREIDLPLQTFERHLETLTRQYRVIPLDDALAARRGGIVVTFDDGSRDFYEYVLPLLVRYRLPAVLYVATAFIDRSRNNVGSDALTWSHLQEAVETGLVTVGAHTHSHANLARADEVTAYDEMSRCKELVEDRLSISCRHFAFPWGVSSPAADRVARRLFDSAALRWGTNRGNHIDPHRLRRTPVLRSDRQIFFRAKTRGWLDGEARVYRAVRRGPWRYQ